MHFSKEAKRSQESETMSLLLKIMVKEPESISDYNVDSLSPSSNMMKRNNLIEMKFVL
jgi:hypothetical protein